MKNQNNIPDTLLEHIDWSFSEPISSSSSEFVNDVVLYYKKNFHESFDHRELTSKSTLFRLDVEYKYAYEIPGISPHDDVSWVERVKIIRIEGNGEYLSYAEILWQLHNNVHMHIKNQDKHYFEGLYLLQNKLSKDIPVYELYLGS